MALLQISEPGQSPEPNAKKRAVGIDLGTTNSLVATVRDGVAETLADSDGSILLPSVVYYGENQTLVGATAKAQAAQQPLNTMMSIKRLMGRSTTELQASEQQFPYRFAAVDSTVPHIDTSAGHKTPVQVSADILSALANRARGTLGGELDGAVITVPAYFDDAQRQATKDAARLSGLTVLRLLNEPTAAAVAYGLDRKDDSVVAVYDLGGGTFDISLLRLTRGVFEVLATGGDSALGGDDFDYAIMNHLREQLGINESLSPEKTRQLLTLSCELKEALIDTDIAQGHFEGKTVSLSRQLCDQLVDGLIDQTLRACKRCLRDAQLDKTDITAVVLVGGSTRLLRVREKVATFFERQPLADIDPDRVVAIGAAIQADILVGNKSDGELLLLDVVPLSLGLETMGGLVEKIIHRNTTIPVTKAQEFTTFKDGQTAMAIHVVQGERELVSDSRSLARFELRGLPPMVAGAAHVRVTFQVDADGLLSVSAQEKSTGVYADVVVKPSYGLRDDEIAHMLQSSFAHAESDITARALREQQVEAERLLESLQAALLEDGASLLSEKEFEQLSGAVSQLQKVHNGDDIDAIRQQMEVVAELSESFAARRMDVSIKKALAGHHLDEFSE